MYLVQRELFAPQNDLFAVSQQGELYPAYTDLTEDLKRRYRFVGQVLGRLLATQQLCIARLAPFFLNIVGMRRNNEFKLLNKPYAFVDLRQRSEQLYQSLVYLRDSLVMFDRLIHSATTEELAEYTMSVEYTNGPSSESQRVCFVVNGDTIRVTPDNVNLYIQYLTQFYLCDSILQPATYIRLGMLDLLGKADYSLFEAV